MGGRDVDGARGSCGGAAGDKEKYAVVFEKRCEFLACCGRIFVGDGEHGTASRAFHVVAESWIVMVIFLDQKGNFPALEKFFEMQELIEIEPARDGEESVLRDAFLVDDLDGGHWVLLYTPIETQFTPDYTDILVSNTEPSSKVRSHFYRKKFAWLQRAS